MIMAFSSSAPKGTHWSTMNHTGKRRKDAAEEHNRKMRKYYHSSQWVPSQAAHWPSAVSPAEPTVATMPTFPKCHTPPQTPKDSPSPSALPGTPRHRTKSTPHRSLTMADSFVTQAQKPPLAGVDLDKYFKIIFGQTSKRKRRGSSSSQRTISSSLSSSSSANTNATSAVVSTGSTTTTTTTTTTTATTATAQLSCSFSSSSSSSTSFSSSSSPPPSAPHAQAESHSANDTNSSSLPASPVATSESAPSPSTHTTESTHTVPAALATPTTSSAANGKKPKLEMSTTATSPCYYDLVDLSVPDTEVFENPAWVPSADAFDQPIRLRVAWKGTPLAIDNHPYIDRLHPTEVYIASTLRLTPEQFLRCKRTLVMAAMLSVHKGVSFRKSDAQKLCRIDVNKTSALWTAFNDLGWFHSQP